MQDKSLPSGYKLEEYLIKQVIRSDDFGTLYSAWDTHLDIAVVIKEYLPSDYAIRISGAALVPKIASGVEGFLGGLEEFIYEAQALTKLDHPSLNKVYRYFKANETAYLILDSVNGKTLSQVLNTVENIDSETLMRLMNELLSALDVAHKHGIFHLDINPDNIKIKPDGTAVLLGFSTAFKYINKQPLTPTSHLRQGYAAIEQYDRKPDCIGPWTDLYSLGIVAYICIRGLPESNLVDVVARCRIQLKGEVEDDLKLVCVVGRSRYPEKLLHVIDWCISVLKEDRPQSVIELQQMLEFSVGKAT